MDANEMQIGGKHYKTKYEVWDFVEDIKLGFVLGNAVKYVQRWQHKGQPIQDLRKALHYLRKAEERCIKYKCSIFRSMKVSDCIWRFKRTLHIDDAVIVQLILDGNYLQAAIEINVLIEEEISREST